MIRKSIPINIMYTLIKHSDPYDMVVVTAGKRPSILSCATLNKQLYTFLSFLCYFSSRIDRV